MLVLRKNEGFWEDNSLPLWVSTTEAEKKIEPLS